MTTDEFTLRVVDIAALPDIEQPPAIKALSQEAKPLGYRMEDIRHAVAQAKRASKEEATHDVVDALNAQYFLLDSGNSVRIGALDSDGNLRLYRKVDFALLTAHMTPHETGMNSASELWLRNPNIRRYAGLTIDDKGPEIIDGKLNLWRGFAVEPVKGDVTLFLDTLQTVYGEDSAYLVNWMAYTLQNPCERTGVILFLISAAEGTGKSTLGVIMSRIFGRSHAVKIGRGKQLTGQFNAHLSGALFCHGDEIMFKGDKAGADAIKTLCTDERLRIEPKGVDAFEVDNRLSLLLTTNHEHAAHIGMSDRRNAMVEAGEALKGNHAYWSDFYGWLDKGGLAAIAHHLLHEVDVSGFHPARDKPVSEIYLLNKRRSLQQVWKWWRSCVDKQKVLGERGRSDFAINDQIRDGAWIDKDHLYEAYCEWQRAQRLHEDEADVRQFWKEMQLMGAISHEKRDSANRSPRKRWVHLSDWEAAADGLIEALRG